MGFEVPLDGSRAPAVGGGVVAVLMAAAGIAVWFAVHEKDSKVRGEKNQLLFVPAIQCIDKPNLRLDKQIAERGNPGFGRVNIAFSGRKNDAERHRGALERGIIFSTLGEHIFFCPRLELQFLRPQYYATLFPAVTMFPQLLDAE
jgi:hypothetical protein